jgi:LAO/AO transport system kinase
VWENCGVKQVDRDPADIRQLIFDLKEKVSEPLNKRLGQALSLVENSKLTAEESVDRGGPLSPKPHVFVLVGPSGVGKSVLIDRLIPYFRKDFKFIAVLATDPSSSKGGGALLGDRVRISENEDSEKIFYRSIASRGSRNSFSDSIPRMLEVLRIFKVDAVLIETMGVAQQDSSSSTIADTLINVLGPSAGDEIQLYKSGILEYGDIFFINKSDVDNSDSIYRLLTMKVSQTPKPQIGGFPKVLRGSAVEKQGVEELYNSMYSHMQKVKNLETEDNL